MCSKNYFLSCWLQNSKWSIKIFLPVADFTVASKQYIRTGHPNTPVNFLELIRTKGEWNQAVSGSHHPQDKLQRLPLQSAYDSCWTTAHCCCAACDTGSTAWACSAHHILALLIIFYDSMLMQTQNCKTQLPARQHGLLRSSITEMNIIMLWAIVQSFPMSIFNLDQNKIHPTGKSNNLFLNSYEIIYKFLKTNGNSFFHHNAHH